jgi:hypothetical protein
VVWHSVPVDGVVGGAVGVGAALGVDEAIYWQSVQTRQRGTFNHNKDLSFMFLPHSLRLIIRRNESQNPLTNETKKITSKKCFVF